MFGLSKKVESTPVDNSSENILNTKRRVLQTTSHSEYIAFFERTRNEINEIARSNGKIVKDKGEAFDMALNWLSLIRTSWLTYDFNYLNDHEVSFLYDVMYVRIPAGVRKFRFEHVENGFDDADMAMFYVAPELKRILVELNNLLNNHENVKIALISKLGKTDIPISSLAEELLEVETAKHVTFPVFRSDDVVLQETYERIQHIWTQAIERENIVDHEFFLEQVATNYLPEALNIYSAFASANKTQKAAAAKTLLDYFEAVETKILQIFTYIMEQNLSSLKSEVIFIKNKIEPADDGPLTLVKETI